MSTKKYATEASVNRALETIQKFRQLGSEGIPGFEWPESSDENRRIHQNTHMFRGLSLDESIEKFYGKKAAREVESTGELRVLKPGEIVRLSIRDITKKGVIFEQDMYKETIICTVNLYQYPTFKNFIPKHPMLFKVMSVDLNKVYVDPFQPLIEEFIEEIQGTIKNQAHVKNPIITKVTNLQHMRSGYIGNIRIPSISDLCGKDLYMQAFIPGSQITLNIESDFEKWDGKDVDTFITNLSIRPGTTNVTVACSAKEYLRFRGNLNIIEMFKNYCEDNKAWHKVQEKVWNGNITGICNTRNKTGVFVEIPEIGITGMVPVTPELLTSYKPGPTKVKIVGFDEPTKFNPEIGQMQHIDPWKIEGDILKKVNVKCVLAFTE